MVHRASSARSSSCWKLRVAASTPLAGASGGKQRAGERTWDQAAGAYAASSKANPRSVLAGVGPIVLQSVCSLASAEREPGQTKGHEQQASGLWGPIGNRWPKKT